MIMKRLRKERGGGVQSRESRGKRSQKSEESTTKGWVSGVKDLGGCHLVKNGKPPSTSLLNLMLGHLGGSVGGGSDFSSGHDLTARELEPGMELTEVCVEPASDLLSPTSLCPFPACALSLSKK